MRPLLAIVLALPLFSIGCKKSGLTDVADPKYKVGQRWSYWARPGEEASTFIIGKVEQHPTAGVIIHVGLDNLKLNAGGKTHGLVPHMPFSRMAIEKSATKIAEEDASLPNFKSGYEEWRKQFEDDKAGIFTIPIAQVLDSIEQGGPTVPPK